MVDVASSAAAPSARKAGRRAFAESPTLRARNLRWYLQHALGEPMWAIAGAESPSVSESAVSRGIAEARDRIRGLDLIGLFARLGHDMYPGRSVA